jgi:hypothetical protein
MAAEALHHEADGGVQAREGNEVGVGHAGLSAVGLKA